MKPTKTFKAVHATKLRLHSPDETLALQMQNTLLPLLPGQFSSVDGDRRRLVLHRIRNASELLDDACTRFRVQTLRSRPSQTPIGVEICTG